MKMNLDNSPPIEAQTECLVIGVTEGGPLSPAATAIDKVSGGTISRMLESKDIQTGLGKTVFLHGLPGLAATRLLVAGFGKQEKLTLARFDRGCIAAGKALRNHALTSCHICVHELEFEHTEISRRLKQAALAIHRANYLYTTTKPLKDDSPAPMQSASLQGGTELQSALEQANAFAAGFEKAKILGDLPANICNPAYLAQEAINIAARYDQVELEILDEDDMAELGMDAFLAVSRGSANSGKLIILKYSGAEDDQKPAVFIGKGVTFDSGGLSLKSGENMMQMKYDMCGAAGVIGAFVTCARLQIQANLICIVAAVENMPDGDACRPGDVITSMSGKTIEVLNTDAEGRLVLCDAITYSERFDPDVIIDVATLTGACVVALGHHATGLISNDDDLAQDLLAAGDSIVDRAWRLPLWEEYQSQLDSPFADMKNIGGMPAGVVTASCFLSRFAEDQRWAHLDVAGSAWKWGGDDGASGRPVGLLAQYMLDRSK
ncbi:MAG: leucyl aminopeptidase [Xanthomonadales bacterium]|nr:leucyl aminopeptidase [Gammaproteobacteria bacterium]MBT8052643.1 leucyl aminopeptidase [Gammaproteobacteria bacterium]NND56598.1 leucyl aminopeptidase [Xanthomonadales bacterium]NNK52460.1 leucyl aminopeptidase [Xanthomonadales bacterium]